MSGARRLVLGLAAGAAGIAALALGQGDGKPARERAYPVTFPAGEGEAIAQRACLVCHTAMLVTQQHKDSTGWEKSVRQMEAWGAQVAPEEHPVLVRYLTETLGPRAGK